MRVHQDSRFLSRDRLVHSSRIASLNDRFDSCVDNWHCALEHLLLLGLFSVEPAELFSALSICGLMIVLHVFPLSSRVGVVLYEVSLFAGGAEVT